MCYIYFFNVTPVVIFLTIFYCTTAAALTLIFVRNNGKIMTKFLEPLTFTLTNYIFGTLNRRLCSLQDGQNLKTPHCKTIHRRPHFLPMDLKSKCLVGRGGFWRLNERYNIRIIIYYIIRSNLVNASTSLQFSRVSRKRSGSIDYPINH